MRQPERSTERQRGALRRPYQAEAGMTQARHRHGTGVRRVRPGSEVWLLQPFHSGGRASRRSAGRVWSYRHRPSARRSAPASAGPPRAPGSVQRAVTALRPGSSVAFAPEAKCGEPPGPESGLQAQSGRCHVGAVLTG